jgi:hypothetical protein
VFVVSKNFQIDWFYLKFYIWIDRSADNNKSGNPIVTIKLSEKDETIVDPNTAQPQQYFAETFFQMNTSTGEWKRIKKLRPLNQLN